MSEHLVTVPLDHSIRSDLLLGFHNHNKKKLNIFNLKVEPWNEERKSIGFGYVSCMLFYHEYIIVEENIGFGDYGLTVYLNDDMNSIRNLKGKNPITKLVFDCYYDVRTMCLESEVDENGKTIDYLIFLGDQRLHKYNLQEWIENSKLGMATECVWVKGPKYTTYNDEGFTYPRAVVCIQSNGKYSNVNGNVLVVADTDNNRVKIYDSKDGKLLKIYYDIGNGNLGKVMDIIYSKELDEFLILTQSNDEFIKCRLNIDLTFEIIQTKKAERIWGMGYESSCRKVLYPNVNSSLLNILDLESMEIEKSYPLGKSVTRIVYDPKYMRFYCIGEGIIYTME